MDEQQLIKNLNTTLEMTLPAHLDAKELHRWLSHHIDQLIASDFPKLINLLYRIDVSEARLKEMLAKNDAASAASVIASLIIERQIQKMKSRQQFNNPGEISDEEKW